jgi:Rrf2 family iron-sulfur cluster assembly transcriptional regulator
LTHDLWDDLSSRIYEFLSEIDLAELVERQRVREVAARQDSVSVSAPLL